MSIKQISAIFKSTFLILQLINGKHVLVFHERIEKTAKMHYI